MRLVPLLAVLLTILGLSRVHIDRTEEAVIIPCVGNTEVHQTITAEETKTIVDILDGKIMWPMSGDPACGFGLWGAIEVDGVTYEPAFCCGYVRNDRNDRYIFLMEEEREVLKAIMEENASRKP